MHAHYSCNTLADGGALYILCWYCIVSGYSMCMMPLQGTSSHLEISCSSLTGANWSKSGPRKKCIFSLSHKVYICSLDGTGRASLHSHRELLCHALLLWGKQKWKHICLHSDSHHFRMGSKPHNCVLVWSQLHHQQSSFNDSFMLWYVAMWFELYRAYKYPNFTVYMEF